MKNKALLWMLILMLLCGCSRHEMIELPQSEAGYQLYQFFDCDKKALLEALEADGQAPQFEFEYTMDTTKSQGYVNLQEEIYGLTWELGISFCREDGPAVFTAYGEDLTLDGWPDGSEKAAIQSFIDDIVEQYGEPDEVSHVNNIHDIFAGEEYKVERTASWGPFITLYISYFYNTDQTKISFTDRNSDWSWDHMAQLYPGDIGEWYLEKYEVKYRGGR